MTLQQEPGKYYPFDIIFILNQGAWISTTLGMIIIVYICSYSPILVAVHYISVEHKGHGKLTLTEEDVVDLYKYYSFFTQFCHQ